MRQARVGRTGLSRSDQAESGGRECIAGLCNGNDKRHDARHLVIGELGLGYERRQ